MQNLQADNSSLKAEVFKLNEQLALARRQPSPASTLPTIERASSLAPEKEKSALPPFGRTSVPADVMESRSSRRHGSITNAQTMPVTRSTPSGRVSTDQKLYVYLGYKNVNLEINWICVRHQLLALGIIRAKKEKKIMIEFTTKVIMQRCHHPH